LVALGDFQGGTNRFHSPEDPRLNHFTACAGQTVFRGDRLPQELRGNVFLPEPVGRLIRRATVKVEDGITKLANPYGESEFIRSTDPNFRPLNMTTGPDGCLYIVDVYRGIIQEGNWVREGSFLRPKVIENGFQNNIGHGRIWRLTHKDFKPGPSPSMLAETPAQLVAHLEHPNGWWRDTAQRMLIVKGDRSVVPALTKMVEDDKNPLARIHAIWTLEGLDALTPQLLHAKMLDESAPVRATAIRAAETLLKKGNTSLVADIKALKTDSDPTVVLQTMMTAKVLNWPDWKKDAAATLSMSASAGVREIGSQLLIEPPKIAGNFTKDQKKQIENGQEVFRSLCFACHGFDGKGMPMPGREGVTLAPPLSGSKTAVQGDSLIRVLLHGLAGPVDGKTYEAQMVPMGANPDQWIADVACYIRKAFGNQGPLVSKDDVKRIRGATQSRTLPWSIEELRAGFPQPLTNSKEWKLTASTEKDLAKAVDGDTSTRWTTGKFQAPGQWFEIELPSETEIAGVDLNTVRSGNDYPRGYTIEVSSDGAKWSAPVLKGAANSAITELMFPKAVKTKFIRLTQTGSAKGNYWSIHEVQVLQPVKPSAPKTAAK
jgi:mono/diheme cytochrome c family protein